MTIPSGIVIVEGEQTPSVFFCPSTVALAVFPASLMRDAKPDPTFEELRTGTDHRI